MSVVKEAEDYLSSIVHKWQSSGGDDSCSIILSLLEEIDRLNKVVEACGEENEALQAELDMCDTCGDHHEPDEIPRECETGDGV